MFMIVVMCNSQNLVSQKSSCFSRQMRFIMLPRSSGMILHFEKGKHDRMLISLKTEITFCQYVSCRSTRSFIYQTNFGYSLLL